MLTRGGKGQCLMSFSASGWAGDAFRAPADPFAALPTLRAALGRGELPHVDALEGLVQAATSHNTSPGELEALIAETRAAELAALDTLVKGARDEQGQERALLRSEQQTFNAGEDRVRRLDALAEALQAVVSRPVPASQLYTPEAAAERQVREAHGLIGSPAPTPPVALRAALDRLRARGGAAPLRETPVAAGPWVPGLTQYRADLSVGTDSAGGYLVPPEQAGFVIDRLRQASVFLEAGPQIFTVEASELRLPTIATSATAHMVNEANPITDTTAAFGRVTLTPRAGAVLIKASRELLDDSNPAARDVIAMDLERQLRDLLDDQAFNGNGTAPNVRGLRNFTGVNTTELGAGNGTTLALDDVRDAIYRLEAKGARPNAIFCSPRTWASITKLKDLQNRYQMAPDPTGEARRSLFGVSAYPSGRISIAETVGNTATCSWLAVCDMSRIAVAMRQQVELQLLVELYAQWRQIGLAASIRFDVGCLDAQAVELVTGITN